MNLSQTIRWGGVLVAAGLAFWAGRYSSSEDLSPADSITEIRAGLSTAGALESLAYLVPALRALEREDLEAAASEYAQRLVTLDECEIAPFVDRWTELSLDDAIAGIESWPDSRKRGVALGKAIENVAVRDPAGGLLLFESAAQQNPSFRSHLGIELLTGLSGSESLDPLSAYIESLSEDSVGPALGASLGMIARHHGSEAMISWTEELLPTLETPQLKEKAFRKAVRTLSRKDPQRAGEWALARWGEPYADIGPGAVAEGWILAAPIDALGWLEHEAPEPSRAKALELVYGRWLFQNRSVAQQWLESTDRTAFHDPAIGVLARTLAQSNPDGAMEWCARVIEQAGRKMCYVSTVGQWARKEPGAAIRWLDESPLEEAARTSVRERIEARTSSKNASGPSSQQVPERDP